MSESLKTLLQFITDFNLKLQDGPIAFSATLHTRLNGNLVISNCDVQIITSNNMGAVYILNNDNEIKGVPDMFEAKNCLFSYRKENSLTFSGESEAGNFLIAVIPKK